MSNTQRLNNGNINRENAVHTSQAIHRRSETNILQVSHIPKPSANTAWVHCCENHQSFPLSNDRRTSLWDHNSISVSNSSHHIPNICFNLLRWPNAGIYCIAMIHIAILTTWIWIKSPELWPFHTYFIQLIYRSNLPSAVTNQSNRKIDFSHRQNCH